MGKCKFCGKESKVISEVLEICRECILNKEWHIVKQHLLHVHKTVRKNEGLPREVPQASDAQVIFKCNFCINECSLSKHNTSYCGLRNIKKSKNNSLPFPNEKIGYIHGYTDANPTNCCNAWICPAGTSLGYPEFSNIEGPEFSTYSYAAFLYGCTFDCLFCQNASHKNVSKKNIKNAENIATEIANNEQITCICYFGGTPEPQLPFTINLSNLILDKIKNQENRKFRICWEWNGSGNRDLVEDCLKIAIKTGGNIKFDLKSFHEKLNTALCGISNKYTLKNFKYLAKKYYKTRENLPELSGCTLLVPGYNNHKEIEKIAQFISSIDNSIPYNLLVFHPDYQMYDLPITSRKQAEKCVKTAKKYLENVHLGNKFLLSY